VFEVAQGPGGGGEEAGLKRANVSQHLSRENEDLVVEESKHLRGGSRPVKGGGPIQKISE